MREIFMRRKINHLGDVERFLGVNSTTDALFDFLNRRIVEALTRCLLGVSDDNVLSLLNCIKQEEGSLKLFFLGKKTACVG